jgi:deazaflavin-dependent oxidoreductase (nitroreductase family)
MVSIVLVTTGRTSGEEREAKVYAFPDGERLVIVAAGYGKGPEPQWAGNLRAQPRAQIRREPKAAAEPVIAAEVPNGPERDRLWAIAMAGFPYFDRYKRSAARTLAVFVLEPDRPTNVSHRPAPPAGP